MMRSLRTRVFVAVLAATVGTVVLLAAGIYVVLRGALVRDFDQGLLVKAQAVASLTSIKNNKVRLDADDLQMPEFGEKERREAREYYEVWRLGDGGRVVARSPSLGEKDLGPTPGEGTRNADMDLPGDVDGRYAIFHFEPAFQDDEDEVKGRSVKAVVMVAKPRREMEEVLSRAGAAVWIVGACAVVVSCGAMWLLMRGAFAPVGLVARRIGELKVDALGAQLAIENVPSELDPVIAKLNDLLGRLGEAFERERAFSSDVAHELRTPLAGVITTLEVCRSRTRESAAYEAAIDKSLAVAGRMRQLVDNLLLLARAESNQLPMNKKQVRVDLALEDCFAEYQVRAAEKALDLQWDVEAPLEISTDGGQLRVIFENLFENAVTYVNGGGVLKVKGRRESGRVMVEIANTGSVVGEEAAGQVTQRFWRADAARTETGVHCGLGLAIVKKIAELLGMELGIEAEKGGEFRVKLVTV